MEKDGEPLEVQPVKTLETGITYRRGFPGLVAELEERVAAKFNGYNWHDWLSLPRYERVDGIAYFRIHSMIEHHNQEAVERDMRRRQRRQSPGGTGPRVNRPRRR